MFSITRVHPTAQIPGTEAHRARHAGFVAGDPVYGETGRHSTETGAKAESAWHETKAVMPGTKEYKATHASGEGMRPYEGVREEADQAAMAHERRHATGAEGGSYGAEQSRYGTTGEGGYGEKGEKRTMMEKVMAAIPGTEEHREKKAEDKMAAEQQEGRGT